MERSEDGRLVERLFMEYYESLLYYAGLLLSNPDLAQDAVQAAFEAAYRKASSLRESPSPAGWLYAAVKNEIRHIRRAQARFAALEENAAAEDMGLDVETLYAGTVSREDLALLKQAYCEGRTYQEMADALGISLDACKKRIQRAKQRFAERYEP